MLTSGFLVAMDNDNARHIESADESVADCGQSHQAFDAIQTPIIVIDENLKVRVVNRVARALLGLTSAPLFPGIACHELLQRRESPCSDCPIEKSPSPFSARRSMSIQKPAATDIFVWEHFSAWGGYFILTLCDVTREIQMLRKTELARKELQAKKILLERHRQKTAAEKEQLDRLLDHLPDALVVTDGDFCIGRKNKAAVDMLPEGGATTCFGLFGKKQPCKACPAREGFDAGDGQKTNHYISGQYFTEDIIKSPQGDGGLLLFRNTTRQIHLIEKIREQQETITRKNDILSSLVRFEAMMEKERSPQVVADSLLDIFLPIYNATAASVVFHDIRPGSLWFTAQKGFSDDQMTAITRACLSVRSPEFKDDTALENDLPIRDIRRIEIMGGDGKRVGFAFLAEPSNGDNDDLIPLFFEPVGAYIHNRLLMRQLEERANTDPMTGLYNRSYLDVVLKEEKKKFETYNIPYSVVVADVNRLKQANDQYGHDLGDRLILTVAERLSSALRETDCVARTGGDEFVLVLANVTQADAESVVARLAGTVFRDVTLDTGRGDTFPVTVSFGAAGTDRIAVDDLLKEADRLMYEAKKSYYQTHSRYR